MNRWSWVCWVARGDRLAGIGLATATRWMGDDRPVRGHRAAAPY
jgi:hypothetical protein